MSGQNRAWCFTINNYDEDDVTKFSNHKLVHHACDYVCFGKEVGEQKTPHMQGYVEFASAQRLTAMKKIHKTAHWEPRRGTQQQAIDYCKKDGDFHESGVKKSQGKRTDVAELAKKYVNGEAKMTDVFEENPVLALQYGRRLKELKAELRNVKRDPNKPPRVIWYWGKAGVGKTRKAVEAHNSYYIKDGTQWWDGYEQQEAIIFDDFNARHWNDEQYRTFLRWIDRYPCSGQVKGSYVEINSPNIYITCEFEPDSFWIDNALAQVKRRITHVIEVVPEDADTDIEESIF